jgi:6-phosphofructokinase 1
MRRIGLLTGGGDCPGLNAVIAAVTRRAIADHGLEVVGIRNGFRGLVERRTLALDLERVRELGDRGGTLLGASNRSDPFHYPVEVPGGIDARDMSDAALATLTALGLDALCIIGGDGTMRIAERLARRGVPIVGVPKTIDNDVLGTDATCGHASAVAIVVEALDRLRTTGESHGRVMVCEVMGRYAGWIALAAGLATAPDVVLLPEMPYRAERVAGALTARRAGGHEAALVVVAEGAHPADETRAVARTGDSTRLEKLGGAGDRVAALIAPRMPRVDVRVTVLGHVQRGGPPVAADRILAARFGVAASDAIASHAFGRMVVDRGGVLDTVTLETVSHGTRLVEPAGSEVWTARGLGIELGG